LEQSKHSHLVIFSPPIEALEKLIEHSFNENVLTTWLRVAQAHEDVAIELLWIGRLQTTVWLSLFEANLRKWAFRPAIPKLAPPIERRLPEIDLHKPEVVDAVLLKRRIGFFCQYSFN
jgi:hypothetical protein